MKLFEIVISILLCTNSASAQTQKKLDEKWRSERPFELIHQSNFAEKTGITSSDATHDKIIAVESTASWCMYCPRVENQMLEAKKALGDKLTVYQFDYDEDWGTIIDTYGGLATSLPGVTIFKNGVPIGQLAGFNPKLDVASWIRDQESLQDADQVRSIDRHNADDVKKIKDKYVLILMWNGVHMWGDENRSKAHEAKKVLGDQLIIYQYWSHTYTNQTYAEEKQFFKNNGWMVNDTPGVGMALIRNGKIRARYQDRGFEGDLAEWIRNEGPSYLPPKN